MSQYFPEQYACSGRNVKVELDLICYATNDNLKGATDIDTSMLSSKIDLNGLKAKVDNLVVDKLKTFPADLSKLSKVVENDVVKNCI